MLCAMGAKGGSTRVAPEGPGGGGRAPDRWAPRAEREAWGKSRREHLPRADQARWTPASDRDDPLELLRASHAGRLPGLLPIKWGRMAASPFGFFRGAVPVMAHDLGPRPHAGLPVQLCGDAHVRNLGAYASPDGRLVFDLNDFDMAWIGPFEWDLKRLAASVVLAGREAGEREPRCRDAAEATARAWREGVGRFAGTPVLELFRHPVLRYRDEGPVTATLARAARETPARAVTRVTVEIRPGVRRFRKEPPLLVPAPPATAKRVLGSLRAYAETVSDNRRLVLESFRPVDVAFKVVGTGSVGLRAWIVLCEGPGGDDPLALQVKEAEASSWAAWHRAKGIPGHHGCRVARAQHRIQTVVDPFIGWTTLEGRPYLVRRFSDHKASVDTTTLRGASLVEYALVCGELLAKAHARTGDPAALAGYAGTNDRLDRAVAAFAVAYAEQTEKDHARLVASVRAGKVRAVPA